jgi:ubiquinone/menaquinone biosynthesis C-methylase UbiE
MEANKSRDHFKRQAEHYNAQWNNWNQENLKWMLQRGQNGGMGAVLDAATGAGFTAIAFAPQAESVTGIDVSEGMLAQARANSKAAGLSNITYQEAAVERMPFPDASFHLVTCRIAAHHFQSVPAFLRESYRVLQPGGRLLIADTCVPDGGGELDRWQNEVELLRDPSHIRNYSPTEWRDYLSVAGFEVQEISSQDWLVPVTFADWLKKSSCTGDPAMRLRMMFQEASPELRAAYHIRPATGGDIAFAWMRVLISAART